MKITLSNIRPGDNVRVPFAGHPDGYLIREVASVDIADMAVVLVDGRRVILEDLEQAADIAKEGEDSTAVGQLRKGDR